MELANQQQPAADPNADPSADPNAGGEPGSGTQAVGGEPGSGKAGPYGTKSGATPPEEMQQSYFEDLVNAAVELAETRFADLPADERAAAEERLVGMGEEFDEIVGRIADEVARRVPVLPPA